MALSGYDARAGRRRRPRRRDPPPPSPARSRLPSLPALLLLPAAAALLALGAPLSRAEPLHHSRSYKDEFGLDPPRKSFGVKTFAQGVEYLVKYGWVNCTLGRTSYQMVLPDILNNADPNSEAHEGVSAKPQCTEDEARKGYVAMQQYYKLPTTGVLDDKTLSLMNRKRCGNRDDGSDKEGDGNETKLHPIRTKGSTRVRRWAREAIARRKAESAKKREAIRGTLLLGRLLTQPTTRAPSSALRRRQQLDEYVAEYQSDAYRRRRKRSADVIIPAGRSLASAESDLYEQHAKKRHKRSTMIAIGNSQVEVFRKRSGECVTWRIPDICYSRRIPSDDQRAIVRLSFRMWSEVIPLCFEEQSGGAVSDVDIQICFAKDTHLNCDIPFDGTGGELAHSWKLGNIHFDDAENYRSQGNNGGINLLKVAVHEIGHVLGLNHTQRQYSVMYSIYNSGPIQQDFELGWEDRKDVQKYYGVCKGTFDTVFDWIRLSVTQGLIYNTYFFRKTRYWMYENRYNRTRYGDPLNISQEWKGVPLLIDAYTQVILWDAQKFRWDIETYFFKGDMFYMYDSNNDRVKSGFPKKIGDYFGGQNSSSESVPDNIDSVFFNLRTKRLQFFKDDYVYIYDPAEGFTNRCCEHKVKFKDFYPTKQGSPGLNGSVDAVYFSHTDRKQYFFKDERVWENTGFGAAENRLQYVNTWYHRWYDICDVGQAVKTSGTVSLSNSSSKEDT